MAKIPRHVWEECRAIAERQARTLIHKDFSVLLLELALEEESDQQVNAYWPVVQSTGHGRAHQDPRNSEQTPKNARYMSNTQALLWCDS